MVDDKSVDSRFLNDIIAKYRSADSLLTEIREDLFLLGGFLAISTTDENIKKLKRIEDKITKYLQGQVLDSTLEKKNK